MNWRKNWAIVPIEIATTPCLQPFESEIVCINKALAFLKKNYCQMPVSQCPTFLHEIQGNEADKM